MAIKEMKSYRFPTLYEGWVEQLIGDKVPDEIRATCNDCPMCKKNEPPAVRDRVFVESTKCCTYNPILANFLIGGILVDEDPAFAAGKTLFEREAIKLSISPSGVEPHWHYWLRYYDAPFGQTLQLRCPYYIDRDGGLCGIWKYRNSRCTTWFCKYNKGFFGLQFWQSLSELFAAIEKGLSDWCIRKLNLTIPADARDTVEQVWGNWAGKEREFFRNCYQLVAGLSWVEVLEYSGTEAQGFATETIRKYERMMDDSLPEEMKAGSFHFEELENNTVRVWGYGSNDSIDLSRESLEKIQNFAGKQTDFDPSLLRRLYELRILESGRQDACDP